MTIDMEKVRESIDRILFRAPFTSYSGKYEDMPILFRSSYQEHTNQILDTPITKERVCDECNGSGRGLFPHNRKADCDTCNGTGKLPRLTIRDAIERCRE